MATEKTQDQINNAAQISCVQRDYNQLTVADQGVRYRECRRNHAASLGKHATDGCGEFLKAGDDGTEKGFSEPRKFCVSTISQFCRHNHSSAAKFLTNWYQSFRLCSKLLRREILKEILSMLCGCSIV
ncbi:hypothetical protein ACOSQ3_004385 [Xanthoceras sorbifolium]